MSAISWDAGATIFLLARYARASRRLPPDLVDGRRILVEWGDPATTVEWAFDDRGDSTLVVVVNSGFQGSDDDKVARALDSAGGFSFVLAALKAWLEHGIQLNIVADHHPDGHVA